MVFPQKINATNLFILTMLWFSSDVFCFAEEPYWDGSSWKVDVGASDNISIRQCGFEAASIVLNVLQPEFDPVLLAKNLEPTSDGISMSRLKFMLKAYGLEVNAYKTSLSQLSKGLQGGEMAIVAISKIGIADPHYIVIGSDSQGRSLFIDYPNDQWI